MDIRDKITAGQRVLIRQADGCVFSLHPDGAAFRHGLDSVDHEVVDDLADLPGVDLDGLEVLGKRERDGLTDKTRFRSLSRMPSILLITDDHLLLLNSFTS
jgi:hypothetical protein